jgi:hypothetical protein
MGLWRREYGRGHCVGVCLHETGCSCGNFYDQTYHTLSDSTFTENLELIIPFSGSPRCAHNGFRGWIAH